MFLQPFKKLELSFFINSSKQFSFFTKAVCLPIKTETIFRIIKQELTDSNKLYINTKFKVPMENLMNICKITFTVIIQVIFLFKNAGGIGIMVFSQN